MDATLAYQTPQTTPATDLVAEANHRIANSLTLLVSMVRMQPVSVKKKQEMLSPADARLMFDGIAARINTISQLHRILSRGGAEGVVSLKPHLEEVTAALVTGPVLVRPAGEGDAYRHRLHGADAPCAADRADPLRSLHQCDEICPSRRRAADHDGGLQPGPGRKAGADRQR